MILIGQKWRQQRKYEFSFIILITWHFSIWCWSIKCDIQPDTTTRLLPGLMTGDKTPNTFELIGNQMKQYSDQMAKWTTKSTAIDNFDTSLKYGEMTFKSVIWLLYRFLMYLFVQIGQAERDFVSDIAINFTAPIKANTLFLSL